MFKKLKIFFFGSLFLTTVLVPSVSFAGLTPTENDYYISPEIRSGQQLLLEIAFSAVPTFQTGTVDMLIYSAGSSSKDVISVDESLYVDGILIGSHTLPWAGAYAAFTIETSPYYGIGYTQTTRVAKDVLEPVFNGSKSAFLLITPTFSSDVGFITFGGWSPHAATSLNGQSFEENFPSATILSEKLIAVGDVVATKIFEPSSKHLLFIGLISLILFYNAWSTKVPKSIATTPNVII